MFVGDWQYTLADYYKEVDRWKKIEPNTRGNQHIEAFLKLHDGHDIGYRGDYSSVRGKDLVFENPFGDDHVEAEGFDEYVKIERDTLLSSSPPYDPS